jgi:hypothetical protein
MLLLLILLILFLFSSLAFSHYMQHLEKFDVVRLSAM